MRYRAWSTLFVSMMLCAGCGPEPVDASRPENDVNVVFVRHAPREVVVLLDVSYSTTRRQLDAARALLAYLVGVLDEDDRFALIVMRQEASVAIESGYATPDAKIAWVRQIRSLEAGGPTNLEDGLDLARTIVTPETRVLLVTNGSPTWGSVEPEALARKAGALDLWTVGLGRHDAALLRRLGHYVEETESSTVAGALLK